MNSRTTTKILASLEFGWSLYSVYQSSASSKPCDCEGCEEFRKYLSDDVPKLSQPVQNILLGMLILAAAFLVIAAASVVFLEAFKIYSAYRLACAADFGVNRAVAKEDCLFWRRVHITWLAIHFLPAAAQGGWPFLIVALRALLIFVVEEFYDKL